MATTTGTSGNDLIQGTDQNDTLRGESGDDTILGGAGNDWIYGGAGDDSLDGNGGTDHLSGGAGNDTLVGGRNDNLDGGSGDDVFIIEASPDGSNAAVTVRGGAGDSDEDSLVISKLLAQGFQIENLVQHEEQGDAGGYFGEINLLNPETGQRININFKEIENIVPCFTPGTLIATPRGQVRVEDLREGDRVITRDNGFQEIRWLGRKRLTLVDLMRQPELKPVLIRRGALGNGLPERDMMVSPNHRMLSDTKEAALYFGDAEVLVAAKHLTHAPGIERLENAPVEYIHFMFDRHEVVLSDGAWSESFQPGDYTLNGIGGQQRDEILKLFPELQQREGIENYRAARRSLKKHEAELLLH